MPFGTVLYEYRDNLPSGATRCYRPVVLRTGGILFAVIVAACGLVGAVPTAAADVGYVGTFYQPPDPLPAGPPGEVLRTERSRIPAVVDFPAALPATATRIMYRSTNARGVAIPVTGTYIRPTLPWTGPGPRPLISFAVGTHGQGDQCAPSRLINEYLYPEPRAGHLP